MSSAAVVIGALRVNCKKDMDAICEYDISPSLLKSMYLTAFSVVEMNRNGLDAYLNDISSPN